MNLFVGMKVYKENGKYYIFYKTNILITNKTIIGEMGIIESSFGKTGKFKVRFTKEQTGATGNLLLPIKRYIYDPAKKNYQ